MTAESYAPVIKEKASICSARLRSELCMVPWRRLSAHVRMAGTSAARIAEAMSRVHGQAARI